MALKIGRKTVKIGLRTEKKAYLRQKFGEELDNMLSLVVPGTVLDESDVSDAVSPIFERLEKFSPEAAHYIAGIDKQVHILLPEAGLKEAALEMRGLNVPDVRGPDGKVVKTGDQVIKEWAATPEGQAAIAAEEARTPAKSQDFASY